MAGTALAVCLSFPVFSQTPGTLTFTFTEASHSLSSTYNYNAQHVLAVWIQNTTGTGTGTFVKTKLRNVGSGTKDHLPTWAVNAGGSANNATSSLCNVTDATTGATLSSWSTKTITWDGKNVNGSSNGTVVADGTYKVTIQSTWNHGTSGTTTKSYTFTKGPNSDIQTPASDANFTTISLQWIPTSSPPPVANFTAANTTVCSGQSIAFTDQSTNTPTTWAWTFTGGTPSTSGSQNPSVVYNTAGTYTVALTATNSFGSNTKTQTNYITVKATPTTPSASNNSPVCTGSAINFTTLAVSGATYTWTGPSSFSSSSQNPTIANSTLASAGTYSLTTTVNGCTSAAGTTIVAVSGSSVTPAVSIAITNGGNPSCTGQSVTFTASPTNGGTSPAYQWKLNGTSVGSNSPTYAIASLSNNDIVTCVLVSNNSCANPTTATSNAITMTISSSVAPTVTVAITSGSNPTCSGQSVTFTASSTNGGTTPSYQWKKNGSNVGSNSSAYPTASISNGDIITCVMTSNSSCASPTTVTSNAITMTTGGSTTPAVSVALTSGSNPTCSGQSVIITASPTNGGTTPTYQWKLNGANVGTNSATYTGTSFANGDVITCVMTSSSSCASPATATSNSISIAVSSSVVPDITTAITVGSNPTCAGQQITFSATPTNGGSTPSYQWKLNGTNVGSDSVSYTNVSFANGDIVTCEMTSSSACASPASVTATGTTMVIDSASPAVVSITGVTTICSGASLILTANPSNGGSSPSYQWKVNGVFVGTGDQIYTDSSPGNGDVITCVMYSNSSCANPLVAISNLVTITVNPPPPTAPTISQNDNVLTSSSASGNQWFYNGTAIAGATDQTYVATQNGSYQVIVSNGCSFASSDPVSVTTAGIDVETNSNDLLIYPNPNNGNFIVSFSSAEKAHYKIEVISVIGQVVFKEDLSDFSGTYSKQLSLTEFGKGIYAISILNSKKGILKKIIVY